VRPETYGLPVVVGAYGERVLTASAEAVALGVQPGQTLTQAEALCPAALIVDPLPEAAQRLRERLAAALYDLAPVVDVRLDGRAWLDLDGVPEPGRAIREARDRLRLAAEFEPCLGLAPGPFSACLAALRARPGRLLQVTDARSFLAPLPATELDFLTPEQQDRLELLGLRTLEAVAAIGPRRLESQLGPAGRRAVLMARGDEPDLLRPWRPPEVTRASRQFEPPVEDREALLFVAKALAGDLAAELGLRGAGAKRLRLRLVTERGSEARESLVRHPLSSAAELFGLAGAWLREWRPAAPITEIALELPLLEGAGRRQLSLWAGGDGSREEVDAALERLQDRYGEAVAVHPVPALPSSPLPDQRYTWVPR